MWSRSSLPYPARRAASSSSLAGAFTLAAVGFSPACAGDPNDPSLVGPVTTAGAGATSTGAPGAAGMGSGGTAGTPGAMGGMAGVAAGGAAGTPAAGGMAGTGMAGAAGTGTPVSFAAELEHFFEENCVEGCHTPGSFGGPNGQSVDANLSLVPGESYAALVGVPSTQVPTMALVGPTAAESYLWHKVSGTQADVGGTGLRMPFGAAIREPASLQLIFDWIEGGAQP